MRPLPVLSAACDGEVRIGDLVDTLALKLGLAPEEQSELLPSGKQTIFSNRVHWAKTYLSKAGLLGSTRRGHFKITPRGQEVLASRPSRIDVKFLDRFPEFKEFRDPSRPDQAIRTRSASTGSIFRRNAMRLGTPLVRAR